MPVTQVRELAVTMGINVENLNKIDIIRGILSVQNERNLAILKKGINLAGHKEPIMAKFPFLSFISKPCKSIKKCSGLLVVNGVSYKNFYNHIQCNLTNFTFGNLPITSIVECGQLGDVMSRLFES